MEGATRIKSMAELLDSHNHGFSSEAAAAPSRVRTPGGQVLPATSPQFKQLATDNVASFRPDPFKVTKFLVLNRLLITGRASSDSSTLNELKRKIADLRS